MDDHHFGYNTKLKKNHFYYEEHKNYYRLWCGSYTSNTNFVEPKCRVKPQGGGHDQNLGLDSATSSS
jgi:hypothetical protein